MFYWQFPIQEKQGRYIELIDLKNNLYPMIPVIVITGNENSPLAQKC